jgi:cysteine desulfurase
MEVDLFALSGHKFRTAGIGALYVRQGRASLIYRGRTGRRSPRRYSAVPNIVGLGAACRLASVDDDHSHIEKLRNQLEDGILTNIPNARLNGAADRTKRLPNTSSISFEYVDGQSILPISTTKEFACRPAQRVIPHHTHRRLP